MVFKKKTIEYSCVLSPPPSPLHSPCIDAAFRVKDHPSPACRWFTTPSTSPSSVFRTGLKALNREKSVFQNLWHSEKSKAYFLKSKPYFFESKPDFSEKMPENFGVKQCFYWQINFLWLNRVFKKVKAKYSFLIYCISNRYNNEWRNEEVLAFFLFLMVVRSGLEAGRGIRFPAVVRPWKNHPGEFPWDQHGRLWT